MKGSGKHQERIANTAISYLIIIILMAIVQTDTTATHYTLRSAAA